MHQEADSILNIQLSPDTLVLIERAAEIEGKSVSDFVVAVSISAAQRTINDSEIILLSVEDQQRFAELLLNPPVAMAALTRATEYHSQQIRESH